MKASRGTIGNVDAYHAANAVADTTDAPGAWGSVDAHHAADDFTETTIALMSYKGCHYLNSAKLIEPFHE